MAHYGKGKAGEVCTSQDKGGSKVGGKVGGDTKSTCIRRSGK